MASNTIFMSTFQIDVRYRLFTVDAEKPEVVLCVSSTQLEHRSRQKTKTRKRGKFQKLRGGKPCTERVRRTL